MSSAVPFPNQSIVPKTAELHTVIFSKLLDQDDVELAKMISACQRDGFFYLNLLDKGSDKMFKDLDNLTQIMKDWFAQPVESKLQTETVSNAHG